MTLGLLGLVGLLAGVARADLLPCPVEPLRSRLASNLRRVADAGDVLARDVGRMVQDDVSRYRDRLDLETLPADIMLDPDAEFSAVVARQREASYQLQVAEEAACPLQASGRPACLAALRASPLPGGRPFAEDEPRRRAYHSAAFRQRAMSWEVFRGRLSHWGAGLRERAAALAAPGNVAPEWLGELRNALSEEMMMIAHRDWSRPPTNQELQRRFDPYGVALLRVRMDAEDAQEQCTRPMMPIEAGGVAP